MKVSVITVSLNSVKTLERTIQSVVGQTYSDVEYIVIDGGSTDGTKDIIEKYNGQIAYWISERDHGIYDAMNKGLEVVTGEIVGILNSDDWYDENAVAKVVARFRETDADMVYGRVALTYGNGCCFVNVNAPLSTVRYQMAVPHPATFIRRAVYEEVGKFDTRYCMAADYDMLLRIYTRGYKIEEIPEVLTYFRRGGATSKYLLTSAEETRALSYQYASCFPAEDDKGEIEETYQFLCRRASFLGKLDRIRELSKEELESRKREIIRGSTLCLFGTGSRAAEVLSFLSEIVVSISLFWDNNPAKQGGFFCDIPIEAPKAKGEEKLFIIISTPKYKSEIEKQLLLLGYEKKEFLTFDELADKLLREAWNQDE